MALIQITGERCSVILADPDEDGEYGWIAACGAQSESVQAIGDTIQDAEIHVDIRCTSEGN